MAHSYGLPLTWPEATEAGPFAGYDQWSATTAVEVRRVEPGGADKIVTLGGGEAA